MDFDDRLIAGGEQDTDGWQYSLRPRYLKEYIGQEQAKGKYVPKSCYIYQTDLLVLL